MSLDERGITELLRRAEAGEKGCMDRVMETLYDDLRRQASAYIARRFGPARNAITLQPTALVNETYLRLIRQRARFENRQHFVAIATRLMFRVLADYQKSRDRAKRGGGAVRVSLTGIEGDPEPSATALDLAAAIERLEALDERKAHVTRLRAIWGMEVAEIAEVLDVSRATVERDWRFAKSWLIDELRPRS